MTIKYTVAKLNIVTQKGFMYNATVLTCSDTQKTTEIIQNTIYYTNNVVFCDDMYWQSFSCETNHNGFCVGNSLDDCNPTQLCNAHNIDLYTLSPCQNYNPYTGMRIISLDFEDKVDEIAPIPLEIGFINGINQYQINATFNTNINGNSGLMYCKAYNQYESPSSVTEIMIDKNIGTINNDMTLINMNDLKPAQNYIYIV